MTTEQCNHDWTTAGRWGVVIGVSRCKLCKATARTEHFPVLIATMNKPRHQRDKTGRFMEHNHEPK